METGNVRLGVEEKWVKWFGAFLNVHLLDLPDGGYHQAQGVQTPCWFLSVARNLTATKMRKKIYKKTRQNKTRPNEEILKD